LTPGAPAPTAAPPSSSTRRQGHRSLTPPQAHDWPTPEQVNTAGAINLPLSEPSPADHSSPHACTTSPITCRTPARADQAEPSHHRPELAKLPELTGGLAGEISPLSNPPPPPIKEGRRPPRLVAPHQHSSTAPPPLLSKPYSAAAPKRRRHASVSPPIRLHTVS
jgi:hypothetical protein